MMVIAIFPMNRHSFTKDANPVCLHHVCSNCSSW